jgi:hypothetical protein
MSLRRPTVAFLLFIFYISPLCDVAQTSDCGMYCYLLFSISPLWGVALTPDCGMLFIFTFRGVASDTRSAFFYFIGSSGGLPPDFLFIHFCYADIMPCVYYFSAHVHHVCICYILCPNCLASTFKVLTWLVDLARCWRRRSYGWRVW